MNLAEAKNYRQEVTTLLRTEQNPTLRRDFLSSFKGDPEFVNSRQIIVGARRRVLDERKANRIISPDEVVLEWAYSQYEKYSLLPQTNKRERRSAKKLIQTTAVELLNNPERITAAAGVWRSQELVESSTQGNFFSQVVEVAKDYVAEDWHRLSPQRLASVIRVDVHNPFTADLTSGVLTSYFEGARGPKRLIDALYNFGFAACELTEDPKALERAVLIGMFETPVLPGGGERNVDFLIARMFAVHDLPLFNKALKADQVIFDLRVLTDLDGEQIKNNNGQRESKLMAPIHPRIYQAIQQAIKILGEREANDRIQQVRAAFQLPDHHTQQLADDLGNMGDVFKLFFDRDDPLKVKYAQVAGRKIGFKVAYEKTKEQFNSANPQIPSTFASIKLEDGFSMIYHYPSAYSGEDRSLLIKKLVERSSQYDKAAREEAKKFQGLGLINSAVTIGERTIPYSLILTSESEEHKHPLNALSEIGFPNPKIEDSVSISQAADSIAIDLLENQNRYLNQRGIRVPVEWGALRRLNYDHFDFQRSSQDRGTEFKIAVAGLEIGGRLDEYYILDFQGMDFDQPDLADSIRYVCVALLRKFLCEEPDAGETQPKRPDQLTEILSRIGHLRFLPEGQNWTQ